jgi:hypothetical protein
MADIGKPNVTDGSDADMTRMAKIQLDEAKRKITRIRGRRNKFILILRSRRYQKRNG